MTLVEFWRMRVRGFVKECPVKTNIGTIDRVVRISAGLLLLTSVFVLEGNIRWFALVGLVPLITAFAGWCPAYTLFGISTRLPRLSRRYRA
jgi:hypothetical protein